MVEKSEPCCTEYPSMRPVGDYTCPKCGERSFWEAKVGDVFPWPCYLPGLPEEVRIIAAADGFAMVRRKDCTPFVIPLSELAFKASLDTGGTDEAQ